MGKHLNKITKQEENKGILQESLVPRIVSNHRENFPIFLRQVRILLGDLDVEIRKLMRNWFKMEDLRVCQ